jgi:multidrug efflux system outer membrane protein
MKNIIKIGVLAVTFGMFAACHVTKPYQKPVAVNTKLFRDYASADTNSIAKLHWNEIFTDTLLQKLITEGISHNINLQTAFSVTRQAQAYYDQSKLAYYPSIDANAGLTWSGSSNPAVSKVTNSHQYSTGLTASWEADIWGKLKSAKKAQLACKLRWLLILLIIIIT